MALQLKERDIVEVEFKELVAFGFICIALGIAVIALGNWLANRPATGNPWKGREAIPLLCRQPNGQVCPSPACRSAEREELRQILSPMKKSGATLP